MSVRIGNQVGQRCQELLDAQSPEFEAWYASEKLANDRAMATTDAEYDRFLKIAVECDI